MNITFEDNSISTDIKKAVQTIISRNGKKSGKTLVEYIPYDEIDNYDDDDHFAESHKDSSDIYMVYQDLGLWNQPLTMVAVED